MRLGALTGGGRARVRHRLRDRSSQGRAGHGVRRVPRRAGQRRGFHPGAVAGGRDRGRRAARGAGRGRGPHRRRRPARRFARLAARFFAPFPETAVAVTGHQRQDLDRRDDAPAVADGGASRRVDRHAGRHHRGRARVDRADHARHRHLPVQHGRAGARRRDPRRVRGVEPRPRRSIAPKGCRWRRRRSPTSAAIISTIMATWSAYFAAKMRLFAEVVDAGRHGGGLGRRSRESARVIDLARERGNRLVTVGEQGDDAAAGPARPDLARAGR